LRRGGVDNSREVGFGIDQYLQNGFAVGRCQMREIFAGIVGGQDRVQAVREISLRFQEKRIERIRVDQVAAGIPEQTTVQVELTQRP
jgi:hypothetical protein